MRKRIMDIIQGVLDELAVAKKVWQLEKITARVCNGFEDVLPKWEPGENEGPAFYRYCAELAVRNMVNEAIRGRTNPTKGSLEQIVFEGFPRVQSYYTIKRHRKSVGVPVTQLTRGEWITKSDQLREKGAGHVEHAEQLEAFCVAEMRRKELVAL